MFYWLVELSDTFSVFNVFRYITFRTGGAVVTALIFVFLFGPSIIAMLRVKQGKGQPIRTDGPKSHLITKVGTPTMGGLMILSGLVVSTVLWANPANPYVWIVLGVTLGFGLIGFYDDYLKVTKQTHAGFSGRTRLVLEFAIAGSACLLISHIGRAPMATSIAFPFLKDIVLDLGWFFVVFGAFIVVGAGNAVNLTDGLDGLAIVPVMIATASFAAISWAIGNAVFADYLQVNTSPAPASSRAVRVHPRGRSRLPVVQRAAGIDYGRYRLARTGRPARHRRGDQARSCSASSAGCSCSSGLGDRPGGRSR